MAGNPNFGELVATTLNLWASRAFADAFTGHNPVFYRVRKNGNVVTGGLGIKALEPVMFADGTNGFQVTAGLGGSLTIPGAATPYLAKGWTNAEYQWAEKVMYITLPSSILDRQGSDTQKISYVSAYKDMAMKKWMQKLAAEIWQAEGATGADGQSTDYLGSLRAYLNRGGTSTTSIAGDNSVLLAQQYNGGVAPGGIAVGTTPLTNIGNIERNSAGGAFWCTPVVNDSSTDTVSLAVVQQLVSLATRGDDYPDLIVTDRDNWNSLASILMGLQRFSSGGLFEAGFKQSFTFDGIDVIFDDNCPAQNMFAINTKYLKLRCSTMQPKFTYKPDPYRPVENWEARWMGQITSGNLGRVHARNANVGV